MTSFGAEGPTTTVVVASYNQPWVLGLCLQALAVQTDPRFEVVVADDGSDEDVEEVVESLRGSAPYELRSLTQPHDGFGKARIQNRAAQSSACELLIFLDGDCIPFHNLVEAYRSYARPNEFFTGAVSYLDRETTQALTAESVRQGAHQRALTRREHLRVLNVHLRNRLSRNLLNGARRQSRPRLKGGNFAVAASLFREVDGFDEIYCGFAKEDSDLRNRMRNAGARGVSLWNRARVCHIWWDRPFGKGRDYPPPGMFEEGRTLVRSRVGMSTHGPRESSPPAAPGSRGGAESSAGSQARGGATALQGRATPGRAPARG